MSELETMDLVKQGIALARGGDKPQARPLLRQAVEREPTNEAAWMWLASVAESPQDALTALERILTLNPMNEKAAHRRPRREVEGGRRRSQGASAPTPARCLTLSSRDEPENELAWMWLANTAETPADAVACLDKVLAINPDNALARSTYERCRSVARLAATVPDLPSERPVQGDCDIRPAVQKTVLW